MYWRHKKSCILFTRSPTAWILCSCMWPIHIRSHPPNRSCAETGCPICEKNYDRRSSVTAMIDNLEWGSLGHHRKITRVTVFHKAIEGHLSSVHSSSKPATPSPALHQEITLQVIHRATNKQGLLQIFYHTQNCHRLAQVCICWLILMTWRK